MEIKIAYIQAYIHIMTGKQVDIRIPNNHKDIFLVQKAYTIADAFFKANVHEVHLIPY